MLRRVARLAFRMVGRHPRLLLHIGAVATRHPKRSAAVIAAVRQAAADPRVRPHARAAATATGNAAMRARRVGLGAASRDERFLREVRRAANAMSEGFKAAQPALTTRKRGRMGRLLLGVGFVAAGAYAGWRAYSSRSPDDDAASMAESSGSTPVTADAAEPTSGARVEPPESAVPSEPNQSPPNQSPHPKPEDTTK